MTKGFAGDQQIDSLLKMTNELLEKLKKTTQHKKKR